jgi:excisionase family DNA binding protein
MTEDELRALPPAVDVQTAAKAFKIGRRTAYRLVGLGMFPVPVTRVGRQHRINRSDLLKALNIGESATGGAQ